MRHWGEDLTGKNPEDGRRKLQEPIARHDGCNQSRCISNVIIYCINVELAIKNPMIILSTLTVCAKVTGRQREKKKTCTNPNII